MHRASFLGFVVCLAVLVAAGGIRAQTAPAPATSTDANASSLIPGDAATPAPAGSGIQADRDARRRARRATKGGGRPGRQGDVLATRAAADPLEIRIAYRKDKTEALLRRPDLAVIERQADVAPTDDSKRDYLRSYYTQLFSEVRKIDPSPTMAAHVKLLSSIAEQRYDPKRRTIGGDEALVRGRRGRGGKRGR